MIDKNEIFVRNACTAFQISKSSYYNWKNKDKQTDLDKYLRKEIQGIALEFPFYGYRRISKELRRRELMVNHKKVFRIMKEDNLTCRRKKAFKPVTTQSDHNYNIYPNLIEDIKVTGLNQVWVSDITYIRLLQEFIYLAAITDIFSRKCIGWDLGRNIDNMLTLNALNIAINSRKKFGFNNLIHHSDRGVQYASNDYIELLEKNGIKISMSRSGNPYDNAFAESFNKTIKVEEVYINEYETFEDALKNIKHFIEIVYNKKRLHSSIGYIPPEEFEREVLKIRVA
jgi:transposase InsO family protein